MRTALTIVPLLLLSGPAAAQSTCATAAPPLPTGTSPRDVVAVDLDEDGSLDLVVACPWSASPELAVLMSTGDGGFAPFQSIPLATGTGNDLDVGDLNSDGHADVVAPTPGGDEVHVLVGDGTGLSLAGSTVVGPYPMSVAVGDWDNDGMLDAVAADYMDGSVYVLGGDGSGSLTVTGVVNTGSQLQGITSLDFDADGDLDLATGDRGQSAVWTLFGDGAGSFSVADSYSVVTPPGDVAAGDLNEDGTPDLVASNLDAAFVSILLADTMGGFQDAVHVAVAADSNALKIGDLDGDDHLDVAVTHHFADQLSLLPGDGTGAFGAATVGPTTAYPHGLELADLDGNGHPDLATADMENDSATVHWVGCGPLTFSVGSSSAQTPTAVTVTGLHLDIVTAATVQGSPAAILSQSSDQLVLQPLPSDPGFAKVVLDSPAGSALDTIELFPSLQADSGGIGGQLVVELDNGDIGSYILGFGLKKLANPTVFPGTWFGLFINTGGFTKILEGGVFAEPDAITTSFLIPDNPSLSGLPVYLQAWCMQGFINPTLSFTNLAEVDI